MATKLFLRELAPDCHRGAQSADLVGTQQAWLPRKLSASAGASVSTGIRATVTGATNGLEVLVASTPVEWISDPVAADVTISGAVTGNIWSSENGMNANVAINFVVDKIASDGTITQIVKSARTTEVALTTRAVNNFTATPGAGVTVNRGDRIRVRVFGDDAGTMGSGFSFDMSYNGGTGGADGDTFVSFTETFTFETSDPAGTQLFLTSVASDINPGSIVADEAWITRGSGSQNAITNTVAGFTAPVQLTTSAGGTALEWYTRKLQAFTLGGKALLNIRALEAAAKQVSLRAEIAVCNGDGTGAVVWGSICRAPTLTDNGEIATTDTAYSIYVSGDDTSVSEGQRLRIRVFLDDIATSSMAAGSTATISYNGASAAAAGDSYVTLPQTVTEFITRPRPSVFSATDLSFRRVPSLFVR